jgi:hypothetical protein
MKRSWLGIALLLLVFSSCGTAATATPATAAAPATVAPAAAAISAPSTPPPRPIATGVGVQYEFIQRTQSDVANIPSTELNGKAIIDGDRSRVDFISATNSYPPGAYVISTNGSRSLTFVDPIMKSYTEVNSGAVAAAIGTSNIKIENLKADIRAMDDHPQIAGAPTDHYHLTISYDMTVMFRAMPLRQSIRTEIDKWTTLAFGDVQEMFLANSGVRTGNPEIDKLIDIETTKIKGLPMKQVMKTSLVNLQGSLPGTKLNVNQVRTLTRELIITSIQQISPDTAAFVVPANFKKTEGEATKSVQTQATILSFEPPKE